MNLQVFDNKQALGRAAGQKAADILKQAVATRGKAVFTAATGASQFEFLAALMRLESIPWNKTVMYHLDEYLGLPETHPASFRRYLKERLIATVQPGEVHLINGDAKDPQLECHRLSDLIRKEKVDVAFVGIGENGHLDFNDPPADFVTDEPFIIVDLAESCRRQQVSEGWFDELDQVPRRAITMSIKQILKARHVICVVPDARKAPAVKAALEGEITTYCPASILRTHNNVYLFLDKDSAKLLPK